MHGSPASTAADPRDATSARARRIAEIVVASLGAGFIAMALLANQPYLDRHFLPSFFLMRRWYVFLESSARVAMGTVGVLLAFVVRRRAGRFAAHNPSTVLTMIVAAILALGAADLTLKWMRPSTEWLFGRDEPLRRPDPKLGWTFAPDRTGHKTVAGRVIDYAFDAHGDRVRTIDEPVDPDRPTILFIGESVMVGEGLTWDESIPARVGAMLGIQSANLAVDGYATDQAYLRLEAELPRFRKPVAVVTLFMTALLGRNLDDDRPHVGPGLVWLAPVQHSRLFALGRLVFPFRRDATVARGIAVTRDVLGEAAALAAARGATPLVVVPQFNHEDDAERAVREKVFNETGVPYVFVEFDADWRLPGDLHPNAKTAEAIAEAIAARLRGSR